jgi:hypothetical protein
MEIVGNIFNKLYNFNVKRKKDPGIILVKNVKYKINKYIEINYIKKSIINDKFKINTNNME